MKRLLQLIGPVIGLGLAVALMVAQPNGLKLSAQGLSTLLREDREASFPDDADAEPGLPMTAGVAAEGSVFAALHAALPADEDDPRVSVEVRRAGEPLSDPSFTRAFGTNLNLYNQRRVAFGLPPATLSPPMDADVRVALSIQTDARDVTLGAEITDGTRRVVVVPTAADGAPRSWTVPNRGALVPPLLAIVIALLLRRVLVALFFGIWAGASLVAFGQGSGWLLAPLTGFWKVFETYLFNELVNTFRIEIIGFVIFLVAMVGIMSRCGGVQGMVELLLVFARSVRSTMAVTWGMGLMIFFDDYANCLLVGNTMRPLTDRMRISREKLAYLVDSTAAPVAGLSLLSTWIAFEVSTYEAQLPGAGITLSAYAIFLKTIPFRFYCLFTLMFVGLIVITGRDYGPMWRAENRARTTGQVVRPGGKPTVGESMTRIKPKEGLPLRWQSGVLPILCVLVVTFYRIWADGNGPGRWAAGELSFSSFQGWTEVLYDGSGAGPIFVGAFFGMMLATFLAGSTRTRLAMVLGLVLAWEFTPAAAWWLSGEPAASDSVVYGWLHNALGERHLSLVDAERAALARYLAFGVFFAVGAWLTTLFTRPIKVVRPHLTWPDIHRAGLSSVRALFFAVLILFSAWMIGKVCEDLKTADYLVALMSDALPAVLLPVLLFFIAALVALSTGSSWSTMSILLPNVVALAAAIGADAGIGAMAMVVMSIGAVLEGSIFGDHCSPISDTTVLSSVSSASDHVDHVRTQAPYAMTTASLAVLFGYLPSLAFPWWNLSLALLTGLGAMVLVIFVIGRPTPPPATDTATA